jgi:DNA invertase Pin-like site-specific DNA recombinase
MTFRDHNKHRPKRPEYFDGERYRYEVRPHELINLAAGSDANAAIGAANAARVHTLAAAGRSARDIVLITGLSRATVYRALRRALGISPHELRQPNVHSIKPGTSAAGATNRAKVHALAAVGHSARDIEMITGLSHTTVWRYMPEQNSQRDPLLL